jgi:hypothetical protein
MTVLISSRSGTSERPQGVPGGGGEGWCRTRDKKLLQQRIAGVRQVAISATRRGVSSRARGPQRRARRTYAFPAEGLQAR